jgi:co-chaperonin GroES (HSP10)
MNKNLKIKKLIKLKIKPKTMAQQVIPVGKKLLLKQKESEKYFKNTDIIIPASAQTKENIGTIVGVGRGVEEIKIGDMVQYTEHCLPVPMKHNNEEHLLIQEGDVFAILVDV